jgi:hypothetical protein
VIKDQAAHKILREADDRRALADLSVEHSIALGEALLTSSIMARMRPTRERQRDLARTLGVRPERLPPVPRRR